MVIAFIGLIRHMVTAMLQNAIENRHNEPAKSNLQIPRVAYLFWKNRTAATNYDNCTARHVGSPKMQ